MQQLRDPRLPDQLTGLTSRRAFLVRAGEVLADPAAAPVALILANIDACKRFNGCHSHLIGDELIRLVARICAATARPGDLVARVGGDSFALLAPRLTSGAAAALGETLRARIEATCIETPAGPRTASVSIGVAMASGSGPVALLAAAEAALCEAKRGGGNRVRLAAEA
jgi:diguanylate cyclase